MTIDERMTICNMSIEGGRSRRLRQSRRDDVRVPARAAVRAGRRRRSSARSPGGARWRRTPTRATTIASASTPRAIEPTVTWGINPGQSVGVSEPIAGEPDDEAFAFMGFTPGASRAGHANRRRVHRLVHQRAAVGSRGSRAHRQAATTSRRTSRRSSCRDRRRCSRAAEARGLHEVFMAGRLRMARRRLLDVPRHESRPARGPSGVAPRRRTATSRGARAARPAARCS